MNRYWRIFATGLSFAIFGIGGVFLTCALVPFLVFTKDSESRRRHGKKLLKKSFQSFLWGMQFLGVMDLQTKNVERLKSGGRLVLANHPSLIDAVILIALIENPNGIIKSGLFNNPSIYGLAKIAGLMRNVEGPELIRKSIESISTGDNLIIFPEGTRTKVLGQLAFKQGAAYIAIKGGFNITPVLIFTSEPVLRKEHSWYRVPLKKPLFTVSVLEEIDVATTVMPRDDLILASEELTEYLEEYFLQELREYERS
ncbi:1-acyl-sn-glycerol-3-phosphate acyltransferase [Polynucleobacter sp. Ross1-W9]|uniref:lysophospholipid acyltransferase family protein n=1 Tax=Polynucleobacter parvulilacunae TaxID=1855631 RepID=UPI001C0DB9F2|nr:lysophospholipid acyltransferase family protein [Polynucleobacter parvulilacunae]MBU3557191.1 1-acyl-sn-glycerol-3-phosphate acyltransferase [Polynucleobacter parvulilacunae]